MVWAYLALTLLVAAEARLVLVALRRASADPTEPFEALGETLRVDLRQRADHGQFPDWLRYEEALARPLVIVRAELWRLAWAALVLAAGGAFAVTGTLLAGRSFAVAGSSVFERASSGALIATSSGFGVFLLIGLGLVPRLEGRFHRERDLGLDRLRSAADQYPPAETLVRGMERIPSLVTDLLQTSVSQALVDLPPVVESLDHRVADLARTNREQAVSLGRTTRIVDRTAHAVAEVGAQLAPIVERLADCVEQLDGFSTDLAASLESERDHWSRVLGREHAERWQQLTSLVEEARDANDRRDRSLERTAEELVREIEILPTKLGEGVAGLAQDFGLTFGDQAQRHVADLRQELDQERQLLLERTESLEQVWRNSVGRAIGEILEAGVQPIRETVVPGLQAVGGQLEEGGSRIEKSVEGMLVAHADLRAAQDEAFSELRRVAEHLERVAGSLGDGDGVLRRAVERLDSQTSKLL